MVTHHHTDDWSCYIKKIVNAELVYLSLIGQVARLNGFSCSAHNHLQKITNNVRCFVVYCETAAVVCCKVIRASSPSLESGARSTNKRHTETELSARNRTLKWDGEQRESERKIERKTIVPKPSTENRLVVKIDLYLFMLPSQLVRP